MGSIEARLWLHGDRLGAKINTGQARMETMAEDLKGVQDTQQEMVVRQAWVITGIMDMTRVARGLKKEGTNRRVRKTAPR